MGANRAADFYRILTEPEHNMLKQQAALLATEGVDLVWTEAAVREVARVAEEVGASLSLSLSPPWPAMLLGKWMTGILSSSSP